MPHLIDGDNLLGTWPGRKRSDAEKRELAREIGRLAPRRQRRIVIVFDGTEPPGVPLGADVLFSGAGRTADQTILALLRRETDPKGWTVVTNDRSLGDQSRWVGARVEPAHAFRSRLEKSVGAEKPEGAADVDYWLEQFGGNESPSGE